MKIISRSQVKEALDQKGIMFLNITLLGVGLIDTVVHRSASLVTSKKNKTALPLEVWRMIIQHAIDDPNSEYYALVRPRGLQRIESQGYANDEQEQQAEEEEVGKAEPQSRNAFARTLICDEYELYVSCGSIGFTGYQYYECFLNGTWDPERDEDDGFVLGGMSYVEDGVVDVPEPTGNQFAIDLEIINNQMVSTVKVLYWQVETPDIISLLEGGDCELCDSDDRRLCAGCPTGWTIDLFDIYIQGCGGKVPCPLCIGASYTIQGLGIIHEGVDGFLGVEAEEAEWRALDRAVEKRKKDLEYM